MPSASIVDLEHDGPLDAGPAGRSRDTSGSTCDVSSAGCDAAPRRRARAAGRSPGGRRLARAAPAPPPAPRGSGCVTSVTSRFLSARSRAGVTPGCRGSAGSRSTLRRIDEREACRRGRAARSSRDPRSRPRRPSSLRSSRPARGASGNGASGRSVSSATTPDTGGNEKIVEARRSRASRSESRSTDSRAGSPDRRFRRTSTQRPAVVVRDLDAGAARERRDRPGVRRDGSLLSSAVVDRHGPGRERGGAAGRGAAARAGRAVASARRQDEDRERRWPSTARACGETGGPTGGPSRGRLDVMRRRAASAAGPSARAAGSRPDRRPRTRGPSITAASTSSPRCAGRQWRKIASAAAMPKTRVGDGVALEAFAARPRPPPPGPSRPRRPCRRRARRRALPRATCVTRIEPPVSRRGLLAPSPTTSGVRLEPGGRDDRDPRAELGPGHEQAVRHVVSVADVAERKAPASPPKRSRDRLEIRERLAGMQQVREPVDDRDRSRARASSVHRRLREHARHDPVDVAREHLRRVRDRLAAAELEVPRGEEHGEPAQLEHPGLEGHARARRRLLEDHRERLAPRAPRGSRAGSLLHAARRGRATARSRRTSSRSR